MVKGCCIHRSYLCFVALLFAVLVTDGCSDLASAAERPSDWVAISATRLKTEGMPSSRSILVRTEKPVELLPEASKFAASFGTWLTENATELKSSEISVIRIVQDQNHVALTKAERSAMQKRAAAAGFKLRFENVTIDYSRREQEQREQTAAESLSTLREAARVELARRVTAELAELKSQGIELPSLAEAARADIERKVVADFFDNEGKEIEVAQKEAIRSRIKTFFMDVYEKPSELEFRTGLMKGAGAAAATIVAWNRLGLAPTSPVFLTLTAKLLAQETLWGPYIKTYMNFLKRKVEANVGPIGTALYGHTQGFFLFSIDKLLIHLHDPVNQTGPWDPQYLMSYASLVGIGSLFGSTGPVGINALVSKGYISAAAGGVTMQMLDLVMPVEGALLNMGNPLLFPLFVTHQAVKFGIYVVSQVLPQRNVMTLAPRSLANDPKVDGIYGFTKMPDPEILTEQERLELFLRSDVYSAKTKLAVLDYMLGTFRRSGGAADGERMVLRAYTGYLRDWDYGSRAVAEIEKASMLHDTATKEQFEGIDYAGTGLSSRVLLANRKKVLRSQVAELRSELKMQKKMARALLGSRLELLDGQDFGMALPRLEGLANMELPAKVTVLRTALRSCMSFFDRAER